MECNKSENTKKKYSVEITENGFEESLEIDGVVYKKAWTKSKYDTVCIDDDFCEQLESNGETDEALLYEIWDKIDSSFFASDLAEVFKGCE